jgi:hypothetical protein
VNAVEIRHSFTSLGSPERTSHLNSRESVLLGSAESYRLGSGVGGAVDFSLSQAPTDFSIMHLVAREGLRSAKMVANKTLLWNHFSGAYFAKILSVYPESPEALESERNLGDFLISHARSYEYWYLQGLTVEEIAARVAVDHPVHPVKVFLALRAILLDKPDLPPEEAERVRRADLTFDRILSEF